MIKQILLLPLFAVLVFGFSQCSSDADCGRQNSEQIGVGFKRRIVNINDSIIFQNDTLSIANYRIQSANRDTLITLLPSGAKRLSITLNLDPDSDTVRYTFPTIPAELVVAYKRNFNLLSPECGVEKIYSALEILSSTFDSVAIKNTSFTRQNTINLEIYRFL